MEETTPDRRWLPEFRRALAYLRPHRKPLIMGLLAAVGVSIFYTFGLSTIVPLLKVIFSEHETLVDWLYREEAQRRLNVVLDADVPDSPNGLRIDKVNVAGTSDLHLHDGDRIAGIGDGPVRANELLRQIAETPGTEISDVRIVESDGRERRTALTLGPDQSWWGFVQRLAAKLPSSGDAGSRLLMLAIVMLGLVVASLLGGIFRFINEGLVALAVQRAMHDFRSGIADHVLRLPMDWHSTQPPGDTLSRLAQDLGKVEIGISTVFGKTVREPLKALGVLALTLAIDWRLLVVALVGLPIGVILMRVFGRLVKKAQKRASQSWGRLLDHLGERLAGIRVVKASNMEHAEGQRFEAEGRTLTRAQTHIEFVDAATNPALEVLAMMAAAAFVVYGGSRVFSRELEPHLFFAAVVCLGGIFDPVRKMANVNNRLQQAEASAKRLFELMDLRQEEPHDTSNLVECPPLTDSVEFEHVSFAYGGNRTRVVLSDVCLRVKRGEVVALVGPNGSGKTTMMSLLLRFYEPTSGRILIDGVDIARVRLDSLRTHIGLVTQDSVVFSDTVRGNIAYGANGVPDESVYAAARLAHVDEFVHEIRSEENGHGGSGYLAQVTARTLSGGQRQRIALARAILRDPPLLILDEATSQVDSESERKIQEALEDVTRGRTTFIIAHRFSTIARADRIIVLEDGRIVGAGTHDQLLRDCPLYVTLCHTQFARTS